MTLDEKLELFYETAIMDATEQSVGMVEEFEHEVKEKLELEKKKVKEQAEVVFRKESEQILFERNKVISLALTDVKRQVLEEEKSYKSILFNVVEEKLQNFMKTEEYVSFLANQINDVKLIAKDLKATIYINPSDEDKKELLERKTDTELTISEIEFVGGIRAVIRERNLLIDNSFLAKMREEKEAFML